MVKDTVVTLNTALRSGKRMLIEGANATMLDIDFGKLTVNLQYLCSKFLCILIHDTIVHCVQSFVI